MPKYLWQASYTHTGVQGVMKEGGSARMEAAKQLIESLGGKLEAFYFAFGEDDVYVIADIPDNATAAAGSLIVGAAGAVRVKTVVLISPEEIDQATQKSGTYRPPGT